MIKTWTAGVGGTSRSEDKLGGGNREAEDGSRRDVRHKPGAGVKVD
jgi:hypothetical protein